MESCPSSRRTSRLRGDVGAILLTGLLKFVLIFGVIGIVGYDAFSIARTQVTVRDDAQQAAQVALDALTARQTPAQAYRAAVDYVSEHGGKIPRKDGFSVAADGSVTLTVIETAPTMVAGRLSMFDEYVNATATSTASHSKY
ncbi:MAG TPA: hypothetical protein VFN19_08365 [Candidatus Nanopelagicales bacterium]|nr:hypothetical protein [Candidatus Nanopelagicales bacterium]